MSTTAGTSTGYNYLDPEEPLYSIPQQLALTIIGTLSALTSFIGSALIVYVIYVERRKLLKRVYHRILLGLSVMDCIAASGTTLLGGWGVTDGSPNQVWARGTVRTCSTLGFFVHMHMSTLCYSTVLSLYFLLAIRFEKNDDWVKRRVEPFFHVVSVGFPISTAIAAVVMKLMNPIQILPGWCWIQPNPPACQYFPEEVECERGGNYKTLNRISNTGVAFVGFVTISINMFWIWWTVRRQERRFQQRFPDARAMNTARRNSLSQESATNAFLYSGAFFITYLAPAFAVLFFGLRLEEEIYENRTKYFLGWIWTKFFFPLQGFFNALIYLRPRWKKVRGDKDLNGFRSKFMVMLNADRRDYYLQQNVPKKSTTKEGDEEAKTSDVICSVVDSTQESSDHPADEMAEDNPWHPPSSSLFALPHRPSS